MSDRENREYAAARGVAADDNGGADVWIGTAVMTLARLLGRRIARERFEALEAANDNAPAKDANDNAPAKDAGERQES